MAPRRAWWVRPVDTILGPLRSRLYPSAEAAFAAAERAARTGPADADPEFRDGMRVLSNALHAAPDLSMFGRYAAQAEIIRRLENHSRLLELVGADPSVDRRVIDRPVFVTGLPRTGTSLLHGLLAQHGRARAPRLLELMHPLLPPGGPEQHRRLRALHRTTAGYHAAVPDLRTIHPLDAAEPEECVFLLPHSHVHLGRARIPDYRAWYEQRDPRPDYAYYARHLRALQAAHPDRRWVLKSPFHLGSLAAVFDVFPDATVVWTHRDPVRAVTSWCSFMEAVMIAGNRHVDRALIGADWLEIWTAAAARARAARRAYGEHRFVDVDYDALVADPAGTAERVWHRLGADVDGASRQRIAGHAARDRRHRPGSHRYHPERYGLDADRVRAAFPADS